MADIRVLLCHSERLFRSTLRSVLNAEDGIRVVGEVGDGFEAVAKTRGIRPDVVILDERLTGWSGIEVAERLKGDSQPHRAGSIILTEQPEAMFDAVRAGARGFLLRSSDSHELVWAIRTIAGGEVFITPQVASTFLRRLESGLRYHSPHAVKSLTERERDVLTLVVNGLSNTEIAARLCVREATVKFHISNLLSKLQLRDRVQLVVFAHRAGVA